MSDISSSTPRFAGLDGLRGWAVIAVVAFHSGALRAGWVGVDLFMALSGFLITGVLVRELEIDGRVRFARFWARRARRLFPALLLVVAFVAVVSAVQPTGWTIPTPREAWGALTYSSNWLRLGESRSYWQMFDAPSAFDHLWSLAIEEQFYLVWPVVLFAAWRWRGRRGATIAAAVGLVLAGATQVILIRSGATIERVYVGTDTRAPAFLAGALCFMIRPNVIAWSMLARRWLTLGSVSILVVACFVFDGESTNVYQGPLLVVSLAGALLVTLTSTFASPTMALRPLFDRPWRAIGRWSYGIYLVHWPVILLIGVDRWSAPVRLGLAMTISTVVAAASYEFFERPVLDRGIPRRAVPIAVLAFAAVVVATAATVESRVPEVTDDDIAALGRPLPTPTRSPLESSDAERVLVVGDSVIFGMVDELVAFGRSVNLEVAVRSAPGCTTSTRRDDQNNAFSLDLCASIRAGLRDDVERFQPDRVVVFYGGTWDPFVWDGARYSPCSEAGQLRMREGVDALMTDLGPDAEIEIVIPPQMAGAYGPEAEGAAECYARVYLATAGATFVRLDEYVCPVDASECADTVDGVELRHDGLHYSPAGIDVVVPMLLDDSARNQ